MNENQKSRINSIRWILIVVTFTGGLYFGINKILPEGPKEEISGRVPIPETESRKIDKDADELLKKFSKYMTDLQQFSYNSKTLNEAIDTNNKKISSTFSTEMFVKRPNKLRANIKSSNKDMAFYYDGAQYTLYGKKLNMYAQAKAPSKLDDAMDTVSKKLSIDPPAADLLYTNPYDGLVSNINSGKIVGDENINGTPCTHLIGDGVSF